MGGGQLQRLPGFDPHVAAVPLLLIEARHLPVCLGAARVVGNQKSHPRPLVLARLNLARHPQQPLSLDRPVR
jgi:hypothetical protein